jgi:hypothetical protein
MTTKVEGAVGRGRVRTLGPVARTRPEATQCAEQSLKPVGHFRAQRTSPLAVIQILKGAGIDVLGTSKMKANISRTRRQSDANVAGLVSRIRRRGEGKVWFAELP